MKVGGQTVKALSVTFLADFEQHWRTHGRKVLDMLAEKYPQDARCDACSSRLLSAPHSLNPIEQVFAKLKHLLRKAAARTVETVCAAIAELLGAFTRNECANYFKNSGYAAN